MEPKVQTVRREGAGRSVHEDRRNARLKGLDQAHHYATGTSRISPLPSNRPGQASGRSVAGS